LEPDEPTTEVDDPVTEPDEPVTEPDEPVTEPDEPTTRERPRSASLAASLSFLWPGLGQLYLGNRRLAAILAVPSVIVILLLAFALRRGPLVFGAQLFADPAVGFAAVAILILFGAFRLVSVVHAYVGGNLASSRRVFDRAVLSVLVVVIVATHLFGGNYLRELSDAGSTVFGGGDTSLIVPATPAPSPSPGLTAGPTPTEEAAPTPVPNGRVTILFTGRGSGTSYNAFDSIMVVSFDQQAKTIQMVSVPRDSASFPFYFGGVDSKIIKINALPLYVQSGVIKSGSDPYTTLVKEVQYLVGIPINYHAVMDVGGFAYLINKVGGIDIVSAYDIVDPTYDWLDGSPYGFQITAGPHHLTGRNALAYIRTRHGRGDSDWKRSARQQQVLIALLHKMASPSQILALPSLLKTLGAYVDTDFPANEVADYVALGQDVPSENITQIVLGPPYTVTGITTQSAANCLVMPKVAELSIQLFGTDSLWSGVTPPADTCK
jgi:polyisoprenyl-teichoic acid--peptidoglycan teichoic acid transferase